MTTTITLSGAEEAFLLSEARRLERSPDEVVFMMLRMQIMARRSAHTAQGRKAMAEAAKALREQS